MPPVKNGKSIVAPGAKLSPLRIAPRIVAPRGQLVSDISAPAIKVGKNPPSLSVTKTAFTPTSTTRRFRQIVSFQTGRSPASHPLFGKTNRPREVVFYSSGEKPLDTSDGALFWRPADPPSDEVIAQWFKFQERIITAKSLAELIEALETAPSERIPWPTSTPDEGISVKFITDVLRYAVPAGIRFLVEHFPNTFVIRIMAEALISDEYGDDIKSALVDNYLNSTTDFDSFSTSLTDRDIIFHLLLYEHMNGESEEAFRWRENFFQNAPCVVKDWLLHFYFLGDNKHEVSDEVAAHITFLAGRYGAATEMQEERFWDGEKFRSRLMGGNLGSTRYSHFSRLAGGEDPHKESLRFGIGHTHPQHFALEQETWGAIKRAAAEPSMAKRLEMPTVELVNTPTSALPSIPTIDRPIGDLEAVSMNTLMISDQPHFSDLLVDGFMPHYIHSPYGGTLMFVDPHKLNMFLYVGLRPGVEIDQESFDLISHKLFSWAHGGNRWNATIGLSLFLSSYDRVVERDYSGVLEESWRLYHEEIRRQEEER